MIETQLTSKSLAESKLDLDHRMARYDSHMNQYGHYSMKKRRDTPRSAILDELVAQGVTLASDYATRYPATPVTNMSVTNTVIDPVSNGPMTNSERAAKHRAAHKDEINAAQAELMRKRRA